MVEGMEQHGVNPEYIDKIRNRSCVKAKTMDELMKFEVPENAPEMTMEEVQKNGDGQGSNPVMYSVNDKIIQIDNKPGPHWGMLVSMFAGKHAELPHSTTWYNPKYGIPKTIEEFS